MESSCFVLSVLFLLRFCVGGVQILQNCFFAGSGGYKRIRHLSDASDKFLYRNLAEVAVKKLWRGGATQGECLDTP